MFDRDKLNVFTTYEYCDETRHNNYDGGPVLFRASDETPKKLWSVEYFDTYHSEWYSVPAPSVFTTAKEAVDRMGQIVNSDFLRDEA